MSEVPTVLKKYIDMKHKCCCFIIFALIFFVCGQARASWLIDAEKYHISVHGTLSCGECHQGYDDPSHPSPADVNKSVTDFFSADMCADCHDAVNDFIDAGSHGGREVNEPADIENCLACHDPHYESDAITGGTKFNPSLSISAQCGICHENETQLPAMDADDDACMDCHRKDADKIAGLCYHCHDEDENRALADRVPLVRSEIQENDPHQNLSCLSCHPDSAQFGHLKQTITDCRRCHSHHDEKTIHDAHITVSCEACHLGNVTPVKDEGTHRILWRKNRIQSIMDDVHQMRVDDEASCARCHFTGNTIGAAALVLPAKSLICMPCHTATFSIVDTITMISLAVFLFGMFLFGFAILSGSMEGKARCSKTEKSLTLFRNIFSTIFSLKIKVIVKSLLLDSLLQQRLMTQSFRRWIIHGLIFYPFVIRFFWGLTGLLLSLWFPDAGISRMMIDKNYPATALLFDITGIMVLFGVGLAIVAKKERAAENFMDMPKHDWPASLLLASIVLIGFLLKGMRISMTGAMEGSCYAFLGYGISRLFAGMTDLTQAYGYIWYAHAVLTGLFVAYLPFSRMLHMIVSPVVMAINRMEKERK